jgi:hypothetical protein
MKKNILLGGLGLALLIELVLTILCFFFPIKALALFGMTYNSETAFMGYIIAWFCLLVSILIIYAIDLLRKNNDAYKTIVNLLGFWWIFLGIGIFFKFGKMDNLFLDSLKGIFLVGMNYLHGKETKV